MFETLNDRELRTSQADLIKNYLFGRSGARFQEVQSRWAYMRGALEGLDDEDITINFLRHSLIVMRGYLREAQVYDAVQEAVKGEHGAVTFASTLENLSSSYVATFYPEHENWNGYPDSVRRAIEVLNLLNIKPMRPLLLAVAAKFSQKEASLAYKFLVALSVRLIIASSTQSGSVEVPLAAASHAIFVEGIITASDLKLRLSDITPTDVEFKTEFETTRVTASRSARYYLRSLEMAAKDEREPWFIPNDDRSIINLEHILPKKPLSNWPEFKTEEVSIWSNRLGNQALMRASDNSDLQSDCFVDKKAVYAKSPYVLTSQVASAARWDTAAIAERQKSLADLAVKTWPT